MKKILLAIVLYVVFLVVLLPASVVVALAPLPAGVAVSGVSGTLWQGEAQTVQINQRQLEQVRWDLQLLKLFTGTVAADVQVGGRSSALKLKGELGWSLAGVKVANLKLDTGHGFLLGNTRLPFGATITGDVSLMLAEFAQGQPWCERLGGKLFLQNADLKNQFGSYPLGNIELNLGCENGQVQIAVPEDKNQLGLTGSALLTDGGKVMVQAKIRETEFQSADMKKALAFLGRKDAEGYYPLVWQGRVPGL
nr:type II secretion system protein N [Shewanella jiangmenensis]